MASSFLFTLAARQAVANALTRRRTLATLGFLVKISKKSLIWDTGRNYQWVMSSVLVFGLGLAQTPGWTTLLTPGPIMVSIPVSGRELDLRSAAVQSALVDLWETAIYPTSQCTMTIYLLMTWKLFQVYWKAA
ncbi:hypothetical protein HMN09_00146600 [Mycena chlorophos]|uniref:Uncharacterized protein n=1 Tax=Mycena chlorophos TaxID=658473 RepID=A0A8H6TRX3_MYCCL|nr:hypothetical protein HMN09_00146600 [Mycena chlorophos]